MKLLFDANLSRRILPLLEDLFSGSSHISLTGLSPQTPDQTIWEFAKRNRFVIVAADKDFFRLALLHGAPPQLIKLDRMDYPFESAAALIRRYATEITKFGKSARPVLILLGP